MYQRKLTDEEFVKCWQKAKNLSEVAEKDGGDRLNVSQRATRLKKHGIQLKEFTRNGPRGSRLDVAKLAKLAKSLS